MTDIYFPTEIWQMIFQDLVLQAELMPGPPDSDDTTATAGLVSAARCCKLLNSIAEKELYRSVYILKGASDRLDKFVQTLNASRDRASLVEHLILLPQSATHIDSKRVEPLLHRGLPKLKSLEIGYMVLEGLGFWEDSGGRDQDNSNPAFPKLTVLSINWGDCWPSDTDLGEKTLKEIFQPCSATFNTLRLKNTSDLQLRGTYNALGASLVRLEISVNLRNDVPVTAWPVQALGWDKVHFPNLQHLEFSEAISVGGLLESDTIHDFSFQFLESPCPQVNTFVWVPSVKHVRKAAKSRRYREAFPAFVKVLFKWWKRLKRFETIDLGPTEMDLDGRFQVRYVHISHARQNEVKDNAGEIRSAPGAEEDVDPEPPETCEYTGYFKADVRAHLKSL